MINKKAIRYLGALGLVITSTGILFAQQVGPANNPDTGMLMEDMILGAGILILVMALMTLIYLVNMMMKAQRIRMMQEQGIALTETVAVKEAKEPWWKVLYRKATDTVPIEKEEDIMFDHQYDGIRELDNSLPPWWVAMFYITIAFAVIYLGYYHLFGYGMLQEEEYAYEMERSAEAVKAYLATQAEVVDETNVVVVSDDIDLSLGKTIYEANCLVCHGASGEGGVGPNFADQYWIHGGGIKDIFRTIKYGVPEKGMIAWKSQLKPADMQKVASYILTFQGTNPPNAKEPQGELYQPDGGGTTIPQDSLGVNEGEEIGMAQD